MQQRFTIRRLPILNQNPDFKKLCFHTSRCFGQSVQHAYQLDSFPLQKNTLDCQQSPLCALHFIHQFILLLQHTTVPPVVRSETSGLPRPERAVVVSLVS